MSALATRPARRAGWSSGSAVISLEFMELRGAPSLWRRLVIGRLATVVATILALRWVLG